MTQFKKAISLKKVIKGFLGKDKSERYLRGIEVIFSNTLTSNSMDIYQYALAQFMEGNTEKAISCIIFTLEMEREHKLTLHLCKTMLFALTQYMSENTIEIAPLKKKHDYNLETGVTKLKKKIKELEKIISTTEDELEKVEKEMVRKKSNLFFIFQKGKYKSKIQELKTTVSNNSNELEQAKAELNKIEEYLIKDEYLKIMGIIVEVCVFPTRFESENTRTIYKS